MQRIQVLLSHVRPTHTTLSTPTITTLQKSHISNNIGQLSKRSSENIHHIVHQLLYTFKLVKPNERTARRMINQIKHQHNFNMIEILIAISIIVTFSGLTGAVFAQLYEETRVSNALLDLSRIQEGLVMYYTRRATYPLDLEELLENGELNKVPKDPWGTDYLFIPHLDWSRLVRVLGTTSSKQKNSASVNYFTEALKRMRNSLLNLPESIEKIQVLAIAMDQPFCICVGTKLPRFPPKVDTAVSREKIKYVAQLMKTSRERSEGELNELITEVLNIAKE